MKRAFQFFFRRSSSISETPKLNAKIIRIDTHGQTYLFKSGLSAEEAEKIAEEYNNKHHKQGYLVEYEESPSIKQLDSNSPTVSKKQ